MEKLLQKREQAKLSRSDVANRLKVSRITVWQWENGKRTPSFAVLIKLAEIYGCTVNDFV